ncbi:MAG: putative Ig domain-containing protein [Campylobacterales bacterium]|nr:putative Ig domain-containing protein [Campylobacterales bacterium]
MNIEIFADTTASNEYCWIDDVEVTVHTPTDPKESCPGVVIPNLEGASSTVTDSFNNESIDGLVSYYYHFTPAVDGEFRIDFDADNSNRDVSVRIYDGCGNLLQGDEGDGDRVLTQNVQTGHQIVTEVYRRYNGDMDYDIDFTFTVSLPPAMGDIPDDTIEAFLPYSLNIAGYVTDDGGSPVSSYALSGTLPAGLSFDTSTGMLSGTPSEGGTFNLSATATNGVGTSNSDSFVLTITVPPPTPPIMHPIANQTINIHQSYTLQLSDYVSRTEGDEIILYGLDESATPLPSGLSFNETTGEISGTPNQEESRTLTVWAEDDDGISNRVSFTITVVDKVVTNGYRDFELRFSENMLGKMHTLGNTVLVAPVASSSGGIDNGNANCNTYTNGNYISNAGNYNNEYKLCAYWADSSAGFPTTRAQLNMPASGVNVVWAGLYWQALVDEDYDITDMQIKIKHEISESYTGAPYQTVQYNTLDYQEDVGYPGYISYSAFADITTLFSQNDWSKGGYITVGDIPVYEGQVDVLGTYGAWTLIVITDDPSGKLQNFSIFDGWKQIDADNSNVYIDISGFYAPKSDVNGIAASVSVFAAEGDKHIYNDYLRAKPAKKTTWTGLSHTSNQTFNSAINVPSDQAFDRTPDPINNQGIDIQAFDIGTTGYNIIEPEETAIQFRFGSDQDKYWPSMIAFSTELYRPNVCYDYVAKRNEHTLPSGTHEIDAYFDKGDDLSLTVAIRSLESDFDLNASKVAIRMEESNGSVSFEPARSEYSATTSNVLLPTGVTEGSIPSRPEIAIGKYREELYGGTIGPYETYFAKFYYDVRNTQNGKFQATINVELNTTIDFGSGPVAQILPVPRCEQTQVYNPQWGEFNVERDITPTSGTSRTERYSLYTQVTGRDFDYSVAHYDTSAPQQPRAIENATVDVELIDVTAFDDNSSFLKCANTEPSIIIGGIYNSPFVHFPAGTPRNRVPVREEDDLNNLSATRAAAFRMWVLLDEDNRLIRHTYERNDGEGFREIYETYYKDTLDTTTPKLCGAYCIPANDNNSECYNCLRRFFAKPICSRDNFAIRPESYRVSIDDVEEGISQQITRNDATMTEKSLAAEYDYALRARATKYNSDITAEGYVRDDFTAERLETLPDPNYFNDFAALEFKDVSSCADQNHTTLQVFFRNGEMKDYNLSHNNAGDYQLWIEDNTWTKVDQASGNPHKTTFENECIAATPDTMVPERCNDCLLGDNTAPENKGEKVGCTLDSDIENDTEHVTIDLHFNPYQFGLDSITLRVTPNDTNTYLYMNDLNKSLGMAAKLEGNITAEGKEGTTLTNFTDQCAAEDVVLWLDRTMVPAENDIRDENGSSVLFQQVLVDASGNPGPITDQNVTLGRENFADTLDRKGSAEVDLYYNFQKPYTSAVNAIDVNFTMLHAGSPDASSNAHLTPTYTPDGNTTINQSLWFYFGRVAPSQGTDGKIEYGPSVSTRLWVSSFCRDDLTTTPNIVCSVLPGLPADPEEQVLGGGGWYRMASHSSILGDGQVNSLSTTEPSTTLNNVNPLNNITFDSNGSSATITIAHPIPGNRNVSPEFIINPDEWLKYNRNNADGLPRFTIHFFLQGLRWKGEGKTGHVVETEPGGGENKRINW